MQISFDTALIHQQRDLLRRIFSQSTTEFSFAKGVNIAAVIESRCGEEILVLFRKALRIDSDIDVQASAQIAEEIYDICYERLHFYDVWHNVDQAWRDAFAIAVLILAQNDVEPLMGLLGHELVQKGKKIIARIDLALMLAGNTNKVIADALHTMAEELHALLVATAGPPVLLEVPSVDQSIVDQEEQTDADGVESAPKRRKVSHQHALGYELLLQVGGEMCYRIPRVDASYVSINAFKRYYYDARKPVIICNAMNEWPAMYLWKRETICQYLNEKYGYRLVPVEIGKDYTSSDWSYSTIMLGDFLNTHVIPRSFGDAAARTDATYRGYLAYHYLFEQFRSLRKDILEPEYCALGDGEITYICAWFGADTTSAFHTDPLDNCLIYCVGAKYIRLVDYKHESNLYPYQQGLLTNTSEIVDIFDSPTLKERFPKFLYVPFQDGILQAGEMLFIPKGMWHYVRSVLYPSFSISYWWH